MLKYLLIRKCRIIEPGFESRQTDVLVCGDRIIAIEHNINQPSNDTQCIEAEGRILIPSMTDIRTHLNVPTLYDTGANQTLDAMLSMGITTTLSGTKISQIPMEYVSLRRQEIPTTNYGCHFMLTSLKDSDVNQIKKFRIEYGIPTAYHKLITNNMGNRVRFIQSLNVAREAGLMSIIDIEKDGSTSEHLNVLSDLCNVLSQDQSNNIMFVGVKYKEEMDLIVEVAKKCNVKAQLHFNTFPKPHRRLQIIDNDVLAQYVRDYQWVSIGLLDISNRMNNLTGNGLRVDNHWYNTLGLLISKNTTSPLTLTEAIDALIVRNANFCGLGEQSSHIRVGCLSNMILWNDNTNTQLDIAEPTGEIANYKINGCIDSVIMNGQIVYSVKNGGTIDSSIHGLNAYRRL